MFFKKKIEKKAYDKTIKKPNYNGFIDIATDLKKVERPLFKNKKW